MSDLDVLWARSLRRARLAAGLLQSELADALGVRQQMVSQWEHALSRPSDERRMQLAAALGTSVAALFPYPEPNGDSEAVA